MPVPPMDKPSQAHVDTEHDRRSEAAEPSKGHLIIRGESGTGHDLLARVIHGSLWWDSSDSIECLVNASAALTASESPLVFVDCSQADVDERLFGSGRKIPAKLPPGVEVVEGGAGVHAAHEGTLVLRHVTESSRRLQARLARVLRDGEVAVFSGAHPAAVEPIRLRVIGTIEDNHPQVDGRQFDPELLRRLSARTVDLPALRTRRREIPAVARTLLRHACDTMGVPQKTFTNQALELLSALQWKGNLDELKTFVWATAGGVSVGAIRQKDVLGRIDLDGRTYGGTLKEARTRFEREYVAYVLDLHGGRMTDAARTLGLQRTNLYRKVRQLAVDRQSRTRR
jgi:two-component system nitrogen regulation response regulator NtrX